MMIFGDLMIYYEYKVIFVLMCGIKVKGVKIIVDCFVFMLIDVLNEQFVDGWEFVCVEILFCEEWSGLISKIISFQYLLIFCCEVEEIDLLDEMVVIEVEDDVEIIVEIDEVFNEVLEDFD